MNHTRRSSPPSLTRRRVRTTAVFALLVSALFVSPSTWNRSDTRGSLTLQSFSDEVLWAAGRSGGGEPTSSYKVLAPISHGNLTIFPVVADFSRDTSRFLTLDEGLRSGEPTRLGQQLRPASDSAGGRDCHRRQAGPSGGKGPHRPTKKRSD